MSNKNKMAKINGVIIKDLIIYTDERGSLTELWRFDDPVFANFDIAMAYQSITKGGRSRGPHEHVKQSDCFAFVGPGSMTLYLWDNRPDSSTYKKKAKYDVGLRRPCIVIVPPGVVHGYVNTSHHDAVCTNYPDRLFKGEGRQEPVDEIRHELDPNTEFKFYK